MNKVTLSQAIMLLTRFSIQSITIAHTQTYEEEIGGEGLWVEIAEQYLCCYSTSFFFFLFFSFCCSNREEGIYNFGKR